MINPLTPLASPPIRPTAESNSPAQPGTPAAKPAPLYVNPDLKFDPAVGILVLEYHNDAGALTNSIPSQKQLDAYRYHQTPLPGETPSG